MGTGVDGYLIVRPGDGTVDLASLSTAGVSNGQVFYFTGGAWTYATLSDVVAGIPPGTYFPETITLPIVGGDLEPQPGDPWFVVGAISFVPSAHTIPGAASTAFSFTGVGQTTRLGLYGDLDLYDLANTTSLGSMSIEGPGWYGGVVVVTPTTPTTLLLRARARPAVAAAPGDFFNLRGATLGITNTF